MRARIAQVNVSDHVKVVVVDVDDFHRIFVFQSMRNRPAYNFPFGEIDRAFVVSVVQLSGSYQRDDSRRIDVVGDLVDHHRYVVTLCFVEKRDSTLHWVGTLKRPPDLVLTGRIQGFHRAARRDGAENWHTSISLMNMELVFPFLLLIG